MQFTRNEGMSNDAPIHECESECETGPKVYRPYPTRLESLTVKQTNYIDSGMNHFK